VPELVRGKTGRGCSAILQGLLTMDQEACPWPTTKISGDKGSPLRCWSAPPKIASKRWPNDRGGASASAPSGWSRPWRTISPCHRCGRCNLVAGGGRFGRPNQLRRRVVGKPAVARGACCATAPEQRWQLLIRPLRRPLRRHRPRQGWRPVAAKGAPDLPMCEGAGFASPACGSAPGPLGRATTDQRIDLKLFYRTCSAFCQIGLKIHSGRLNLDNEF